MGFVRTLSRHHVRQLWNLNITPQCLTNPINKLTTSLIFSISHQSSSVPSFLCRYASLSAQFESRTDTDSDSIGSSDAGATNKKAAKKPLNLLFKEAVGLSEKVGHSESEGESESGNDELKRRLRKLEMEVRSLTEDKPRGFKKNQKERENPKKKNISKDNEVSNVDSKKPRRLSATFTKNAAAAHNRDLGKSNVDSKKPRRLSAMFTKNAAAAHKRDLGKENNNNNNDDAAAAANKRKLTVKESSFKRVEEPIVYKELSSDMAFFANHLYKQGYFKDANFLPGNKFDVTCIENNYGRDFLKYAAEKFGKDNHEVAKWLSGNDLKTVALFGCPSLTRKNIFSAKTLRTFFKIQEDTVCSKCVLKPSCKFPNQSIWKVNTKNLDLAVVMRVITLYALEMVPSELVVPDEVKASVSRLLKEIRHLSETVS